MIRANQSVFGPGIALIATTLVGISLSTAIAAPKPTLPTPKPSVQPTPAPKTQPKPQGSSKPSTASIKDTVLVPGEKIGPITAKSTYEDLVKIFGAESLSDIRPPDADDTEKEIGTRVNLGPDLSLTLVWHDKTKTKLYEAIDLGPGWKMPNGLRIGMPMTEIQKILGPFQMVGLGGPYGGVIPLSETTLKQYYGKIIVQMAPVKDAAKKFPKEYKAVEGERLIASTDPNWKALGMTVKYLVIVFPRTDT
ncbi:MAG: hypothetical protein HC852_19505 [Acaryochloridaceae cyanobacterium RU_4_10]|nr:hypothetical protein [Acaryochloridaceae cyanobacterium RU_4_10]